MIGQYCCYTDADWFGGNSVSKLLPQSEILNSDWFGENSQLVHQYHSTVAVAIAIKLSQVAALKMLHNYFIECNGHGASRLTSLFVSPQDLK